MHWMIFIPFENTFAGDKIFPRMILHCFYITSISPLSNTAKIQQSQVSCANCSDDLTKVGHLPGIHLPHPILRQLPPLIQNFCHHPKLYICQMDNRHHPQFFFFFWRTLTQLVPKLICFQLWTLSSVNYLGGKCPPPVKLRPLCRLRPLPKQIQIEGFFFSLVPNKKEPLIQRKS